MHVPLLYNYKPTEAFFWTQGIVPLPSIWKHDGRATRWCHDRCSPPLKYDMELRKYILIAPDWTNTQSKAAYSTPGF